MPGAPQPAHQRGGRRAELPGLGREPGQRLPARGHRQRERVERARQGRAPGVAARRVGDRQPPLHLRRVGERHHDAVGPLAGQPQQARPVGREPDRRAARRHGRRAGWAVPSGDPENIARIASRAAISPSRALRGRRERDPVGAVLGDVGAGAEPHDEPPLRQHVDDRQHLGGDRRAAGTPPTAPRSRGGRRASASRGRPAWSARRRSGSPLTRPGDWRWSLTHTPSNPSASARCAIARISSHADPYWGIRTPIAGPPAIGRGL